MSQSEENEAKVLGIAIPQNVIGLNSESLQAAVKFLFQAGLSESRVRFWIEKDINTFQCCNCHRCWYAYSPLCPDRGRIPRWQFYGGRGLRINYREIEEKLPSWTAMSRQYMCVECITRYIPTICAELKDLSKKEWTKFLKSVWKEISFHNPGQFDINFWIAAAAELASLVPPSHRVAVKWYTRILALLHMA